ncbi:Holliday junction DNA helicase RuvA [candidate division WOR-1 bacterium RIFOXYC2_FULL_37_10]|uniref:Putative pre-16S rRNA nuclease n=1 Tax=candidate division WOR-1 bacterium RIFOXYB2_FULL_37_13 TaxID=1802579 RepID=A0A1F4SR74_UNCSA|nr:MAG: Holliday junction DNA helicase RuvA [candidate division WOR-1 bacterium RIFOXYA2_FULL_37_7]OGC22173.1 MAG: Holliday junction DNA helicase RuvA [candidate division WOR-1 bacterium RIFOXYB2_FULL_37_13]OGC37083.1 MAG: Holliday junction DNA helicase RuvA [candidate division WOR-1 bacterium RIFOXYC2_FULL_37_10]
MRILCLDYGTKRIGVAVSDPLGLTAQGVQVVNKGASFIEDIKELEKIIGRYEEVEEIVVGLPKTMSGEIGIAAEKVLEFVGFLKDHFKGKKITTWDERLTTKIASRMFRDAGISTKKSRGIIDKSAAVFILQNYLDSM